MHTCRYLLVHVPGSQYNIGTYAYPGTGYMGTRYRVQWLPVDMLVPVSGYAYRWVYRWVGTQVCIPVQIVPETGMVTGRKACTGTRVWPYC